MAGTSMTYAKEIQAVRRVQRKYLWRLVVMPVVCQSCFLPSMSSPRSLMFRATQVWFPSVYF